MNASTHWIDYKWIEYKNKEFGEFIRQSMINKHRERIKEKLQEERRTHDRYTYPDVSG